MKISEADIRRPLKLKGVVQPSLWGKKGDQSIISRFTQAAHSGHLAELWFGSHPKGASMVVLGDIEVSLRELISLYPLQILGERVFAEFGAELPFLFKVLSIARPLSIQAHPDKALAAALHAKDPINYPDPMHKPEIAIAVNQVEILCGFRSVKEIEKNIATIPELRALLGMELSERLLKWEEAESDFLRTLYSAIVFSKADVLKRESQALISRLKQSKQLSREDRWVLDCASDYPEGDIGLFSFYVLNLIKLASGQMISTGPNTPHAYLTGDLIECMANSDNVVRAGLTNKYKDQSTLISMLEYSPYSPQIMHLASADLSIRPNPFREFEITVVPSTGKTVEIDSDGSVSLFFNLEGESSLRYSDSVLELKPGDAYLVPDLLDRYQVSSKGMMLRVSVPR